MMNSDRIRALLQRRKKASEKLRLEELKKMDTEIVIGETQLCSFCGRLDHNYEACERRRKAAEKDVEMQKKQAILDSFFAKNDEDQKAEKHQESEADAPMKIPAMNGKLIGEIRQESSEAEMAWTEIPIMIGETELCSFCGRLDHNFKDCARRLDAVEELEKEREREKALPELGSIVARLNEHLRDVRITLK